jgi:lysophospholipase L1-like esterase
MLAAIGDSYSQAYDISPDLIHHRDNVRFSWVLGYARGDGIFSLKERFEALGAHPVAVDAATSGRKMADAERQASVVVEAARGLPVGATVYVTFELGANDLCDEPKTDPAVFESQLRRAIAVLRDGLPAGSRILMLSVPDYSHFHAMTQDNPVTRAFFATLHPRRCAPFLGASSPTPLNQARAILRAYDVSLVEACAEIESTDGATGRLHCTSSLTGLAERDFTVADLSAYDYFHPAYSGQAKMAEAAWRVGDWGAIALPAGAWQ